MPLVPLPKIMTAITGSPSFEMALQESETLMLALESQSLTPQTLESQIAALVRTENGARGFLVTYLTADSPNGDRLSPEILNALAQSPEIVGELLVKNLAMSAAMAVFHSRRLDEVAAQSSRQVCRRSQTLIEALKLSCLPTKLEALRQTLVTGQGDYQNFLERWHYDPEQKQAILAVLATLNPPDPH
jgi:hypothetical protein